MSNVVINADTYTRTWNHLVDLQTGHTLSLSPGETAETELPQLYDADGEPREWDDPYLKIIDGPYEPSVSLPDSRETDSTPVDDSVEESDTTEDSVETPEETDSAEAPADPVEE